MVSVMQEGIMNKMLEMDKGRETSPRRLKGGRGDGYGENTGPLRLCEQNPHTKFLSSSLSKYGSLMDKWLENKSYHSDKLIGSKGVDEKNWKRYDAFEVMGSCKMNCIGGRCKDDSSKYACGMKKGALTAPCTIYSVGGNNNEWEFEMGLLETTACEIHTFDCKGPSSRFVKPNNDRLHFHHVCIGPENKPSPARNLDGETWTLEKAQQTLKHTKIDLLKLNIDGLEFPLFETWPDLNDKKSSTAVLPMQMIVDMSYVAFDDRPSTHHKVMVRDGFPKTAKDMIELEAKFLNMGYAVVHKKDDPYCKHCTELTLVRIRCPQSPLPMMSPSSFGDNRIVQWH